MHIAFALLQSWKKNTCVFKTLKADLVHKKCFVYFRAYFMYWISIRYLVLNTLNRTLGLLPASSNSVIQSILAEHPRVILSTSEYITGFRRLPPAVYSDTKILLIAEFPTSRYMQLLPLTLLKSLWPSFWSILCLFHALDKFFSTRKALEEFLLIHCHLMSRVLLF